jgi:hypothetical protein
MSWSSAVSDLRSLLSDGPTDRFRFLKGCFGTVDDSNRIFKTFENRRVTNLVSATSPLGVYVSGTLVTVSSDDPVTGQFTLAVAPTGNSKVEASYYVQWFMDAELTGFLTSAANWLGLSGVYDSVEAGLQPAALKYAAHDAYQKLSLKWAEQMSETFRSEDIPADRLKELVSSYQSMSNGLLKEAVILRDSFYTRQGKAKGPLFSSAGGHASDLVPRR